jgi:hypothetical protein
VVGAGVITTMTTVFATLQGVLPGWVRGRGAALAMLTVWLVTAPAAYGWGTLASVVGVPSSLTVAAIGCAAVALVVARPLRIGGFADVDNTPVSLAMPAAASVPEPLDGPVLVTVEWIIDPGRRDEFAAAMKPVRRHRRRDGAMTWGLYYDITNPGRIVESFTVASWAEHERQHGRTVASDGPDEAAAHSMLVNGPPVVVHYLNVGERHHDHTPDSVTVHRNSPPSESSCGEPPTQEGVEPGPT